MHFLFFSFFPLFKKRIQCGFCDRQSLLLPLCVLYRLADRSALKIRIQFDGKSKPDATSYQMLLSLGPPFFSLFFLPLKPRSSPISGAEDIRGFPPPERVCSSLVPPSWFTLKYPPLAKWRVVRFKGLTMPRCPFSVNLVRPVRSTPALTNFTLVLFPLILIDSLQSPRYSSHFFSKKGNDSWLFFPPPIPPICLANLPQGVPLRVSEGGGVPPNGFLLFRFSFFLVPPLFFTSSLVLPGFVLSHFWFTSLSR